MTFAFGPTKFPDPSDTPLLEIMTLVIEAVLPDPESDKVSSVIVAGALLLLLKTTCWTGTFEVPGNWLELPGAPVPWVACTTTWVEVEVGVTLGVKVVVLEAVEVGVKVSTSV